MLLLPVGLLFWMCWEDKKKICIAFSDKCHVAVNQQQNLLSRVLSFKKKKKNTVLQPAPKITGLCEIIPIQICLCTISDYVFFLISPLTGEKPFSCPHCNRAFADRSNLRAHLQTHSDVKKYQCKNCSKTFSRMSLLHKHEESGCCVAHWTGILFHHQKRKEKKKPPKKQQPSVASSFFQILENCQGITSRGFVPKTFFFFFFFLFQLWAAHFISEWEIALCSRASCFKQCFCDCNQCRALSYRLPVLFMHFSACLECFIRFHDVICSVCTDVSQWLLYSPPLFYMNHTNNTKRSIMNDSIKESWSHCYLGNKCKLSL